MMKPKYPRLSHNDLQTISGDDMSKPNMGHILKSAENIITFAMLRKSTSPEFRGAITMLKVDLVGIVDLIVQTAYNRAVSGDGINIKEMNLEISHCGYTPDDILPARWERDTFEGGISIKDVVEAAITLNDMDRIEKMSGLVSSFASGDINSVDFRVLMADTLDMAQSSKLVNKNDGVTIMKESNQKPNTVSFGVPTLDIKCVGMRKSRMTVLASRPGVGKSDLALHIARENMELGKNVLIASIEMDREEIVSRMAIPVGEGFMARPEDRLKRKIGGAEHLRDVVDGEYYIYDEARMTVAQIAARVDDTIDLVIVDYMQLVQAERHYKSEYERVSAISDSLRAAAKESSAAWLVLSQLSRPPTKTDVDSRMPNLSDLRGSGAIEQDAYAVLLMNLEGDRVEEGDQPVLLNLAKNRGGRTASVSLFATRHLHQWRQAPILLKPVSDRRLRT